MRGKRKGRESKGTIGSRRSDKEEIQRERCGGEVAKGEVRGRGPTKSRRWGGERERVKEWGTGCRKG